MDLPVARVQVDVGLPHLDRLFDYAVPDSLEHAAIPGTRVRVRFAGRLVDGFVIERVAQSQQERLIPLSKSLSDEVVLPQETIELIRAVADHYAGTFSDVVRLAVPSRHAATEKAEIKQVPTQPEPDLSIEPLASYPDGAGYLKALASGASPRAAWTVVPVAAGIGDWAEGFAAAAAACVVSGRSVVIVVPDVKDVGRVLPAVERRVGKALVVRQSADLGPSARYRSFLRGLRGQARVVVGTRSAVFAPVDKLGLMCVWDDGDDLLGDPHAPYPHARDVAAMRVTQRGAGLLLGSYSRTAEVQSWVGRGWLHPIAMSPDQARMVAPAVRVAADDDFALERDPSLRAARLPHQAFSAVRAGLAQGPVLVQVPRAGYVVGLHCLSCREQVRCPHCQGRVRTDMAGNPANPITSCTWCGRTVLAWNCPHCGATKWRSSRVGSARTAEELGKAFPGIAIRESSSGNVLTEVDSSSCLVVATPGAEPTAEGGYAAALLLDTSVLLNRPDLRAAEEALRRWFLVTALVRPARDGGTVVAVGPSQSRALQALTRVDPVGFAEREIAERTQAGFPPAVRLVVAQGEWTALTDLAEALGALPSVEILGPALVSASESNQEPLARLVIRSSLAAAPSLVEALRAHLAYRSAHKDQRLLRVKVDPIEVG